MLNKKLFKPKKFKESVLGSNYQGIRYACPFCKRKFTEYQGSTHGILLHISKIAQGEVMLKALKKIKKTPHFDFWFKNTYEQLDNYGLKTSRRWKPIVYERITK